MKHMNTVFQQLPREVPRHDCLPTAEYGKEADANKKVIVAAGKIGLKSTSCNEEILPNFWQNPCRRQSGNPR